MIRPSAFLAIACMAVLSACSTGAPATPKAVPKRIVASAADSIREYDSGQLHDFHGHYSSFRRLVMPSPGLRMPAFEEVAYPTVDFSYVEFNLVELHDAPLIQLEFENGADLAVLAGNRLQLLRVGDGEVVLEAAPRQPEQSVASLQIERTADGYRICLNQQCDVVEFPAAPRDMAHRVRANTDGGVLLFNPQAVDGAGNHQREFQGASSESHSPAPRRVLSWERFAKALYHTAITFDAAYRICSDPAYTRLDGCPLVMQRMPEISRNLALQLAQWTNWRTFDAVSPPGSLPMDPDFSSWDKGNWANGYLPYATVLLAMVADGRTEGPTFASVLPAYRRLGEAYLRNEIFHERAGHWIRRSNNHGAIILGNGYAAHLLANTCQEDELAKSLRDSFRKLAQGSFHQGVYIESFTYLQVFMMESLPAVYTRQQCFGESFDTAFSQLYGDVTQLEIAAASHFLTMPDGRVLTPFGDCCGTSAWREDSLLVLGRAFPLMARLAEAGLNTAEGNPALVFLSEDMEGDQPAPPPPPPAAAHTNGRATPTANLECLRSDVGLVAAHVDTGFGAVQSAALSTRLHLTHNRDWDLGSVYLAVAGEVLIGERMDGNPAQLRHATRHSTAWSSGMGEQHPGCFGHPDGQCIRRSINGEVFSFDATERSCTAKVRLNGSSHAYRQWRVESADEGEVRLRFDDYFHPAVDGPDLLAHFELPADINSSRTDNATLRLVRPEWEAEIQIEGYRIDALEPRDTPYGRYMSLDLSAAGADVDAGAPTPAGSLVVTVRPIR